MSSIQPAIKVCHQSTHPHIGIWLLPDVPEDVTLATSSSTPPIEGKDDLELTCIVGEEGNPPTDSYYWKYPGSSGWLPSTDNTRSIGSSDLRVGLHEGIWTCQAANTIGNTTAATVEVTVHGRPMTVMSCRIVYIY